MFPTAAGPIIPTGILLPESVLSSSEFAILAAFVAINTVVYASLALANILPRIYPTDWVTNRNRRTETRSIYPDSQV
ncbi:hypothetical protein [Arthrobacter burdickii]|uniref:Uncharacterized protein n=1 Tax=Arthrobacter burdickii TaxID=3035920 RepID=A0ABT8JZB8_9MICC|nr:hypothetical protein [Arthrobacter burdickii]MDN4610177.1 hypothetical protein [Arthrobacter burdickii]